MRYAYTAESARLLQTLLREPWRSDGSEDSSPRSTTSHRHPPSPETTHPDKDEPESGKNSPRKQITEVGSTSYKKKDRGDFSSLYDNRFDRRGVEKVRIEKKTDNKCQENDQDVSRSENREKESVGGGSSYLMEPDRSEVNLDTENGVNSKLAGNSFDSYSRERAGNSCPLSARSILEYKSYRYEAEEFKQKSKNFDAVPVTSPHTEQKLTFSNNFQDQLENLDSVPSKDSGRTESTLIVREAGMKETCEENIKQVSEKSVNEGDVDFKFQRWFTDFEKHPEKNVRFYEENDKNGDDLIDLTGENGSSVKDQNSGASFDSERKLVPEKLKPDVEPGDAATPRDSTLDDLVNILHVLETEDTSHGK